MKQTLILIAAILALAACYHKPATTSDAWQHSATQPAVSEAVMDSLSFYTTHHYTENYNFIVTADSLCLLVQQPVEILIGMVPDTVTAIKGDRIVVADIQTVPIDTVDSVWVQLARDEETIGWTHESDLLARVSPFNPVSRFIDFFSDTHQLILMAAIIPTVAILLIVRLLRHRSHIVHYRDIPSFYPTLLCLLVATSAVLYNTIQITAPESWRHFYYHPTLNPFARPLHLGLFISSVWAMLITAIAAFDDIRRLPFGEALLYWTGLIAVCAVNYVVFSFATLVFVGWPLLAAYVIFALWRYYRFGRASYQCGQCGQPLPQKGTCPHCGALNT